MTRPHLTAATVGTLLTVLAAPVAAQQAPPAPILGRWHGFSVCVKADWNASCNDEEVMYDFVPVGQRADSVTLHASKLVSGAFEPMYDLDFHLDPARHRWTGDFSNQRVSIQWRYEVSDTLLTGTVVLFPSGRVGRNVVARRPAEARRASP